MNLTDCLQCPKCQGRLATADDRGLQCTSCGRGFATIDGIVDFLAGRPPPGADCYSGVTPDDGLLATDLPMRVRSAAGRRWPQAWGDVIEFGCGPVTIAMARDEIVRSMLVVDSEVDALLAWRQRLPALHSDCPIAFATLGVGQKVIRDAVADTVVGSSLLAGIGDVRGFLTLVHRLLKPRGRALFVVPNRRYYQAVCQALAETLTLRFARDGAWPEGSRSTMNFLAASRRLIVHHDDLGLLASLAEKHLFDSSAMEDLGREIGFSTAEMVPLDPDPAGTETITQLCRDAGAQEAFAHEIGALAAAAGRPYLSLLSEQDQSAFGLFWLTKASGPEVRIYSTPPALPAATDVAADVALAGLPPRWSVELLARDTPDGIALSVGGWCLCNTDVQWVRISLDGVARDAPVWRDRPDVHEVLNRGRIYHALNALCSGIESDLLFAGVHSEQSTCPLRVDIVLASGLIITGPAPDRLAMDEPVVVAH